MDGRERLLTAARALFVERGYDAVGTQEIVERAGVTKPSLYHHFGSKRGLLDAVVEQVGAELRCCVGTIDYHGDLTTDLRLLVGGLLEYARTHPEHARLLLAAQNGPVRSETRQAFAGPWSWLIESTRALFRAAEADHGNMRGRSHDYTVSFLGVVGAYVVLELDRPPERSDLVAQIVRQFSHGIYS